MPAINDIRDTLMPEIEIARSADQEPDDPPDSVAQTLVPRALVHTNRASPSHAPSGIDTARSIPVHRIPIFFVFPRYHLQPVPSIPSTSV